MTTFSTKALFAIEGRMDRTTFLAYLSFYSVVFFSFYSVIYVVYDFVPEVATGAIGMIADVVTLGLCVPLLIRRAHDFDESGWFAFIVFVPFVNLIFFTWPGSPIPNRFGDVPPECSTLTKIFAVLYPVWPIIVLWFILQSKAA